MSTHGYKKYMKKNVRQEHPQLKIFIISFFGALLLSTFIINSFAQRMSVDTSVGDYKEQQFDDMEDKKIIDVNRLEMIQNEDRGRNFTDLMQKPVDEADTQFKIEDSKPVNNKPKTTTETENNIPPKEIIYKVFIGSYSSSEQATVAKEIIQETGSGLTPIVKCIGTNEYTLQVGRFKNKQGAETMLETVRKNNLPGRIVQE